MYLKLLVAIWCLSIHAAPLPDKNAVTLVSNNQIYKEDKKFYIFNFETSNGIKREEQGRFAVDDDGETALYVTGLYSFQTPDGRLVKVNYSAGKGGFRIEVPATDTRISSTLLCSLCGG